MFDNIKKLIQSEKNLVIGALIFFVVAIAIIIVIAFNSSGSSIRIDNLSDYSSNLSSDVRQRIQTALYDLVKMNTDKPPTSGAVVRNGSFSSEHDSYEKLTYIHFIVDIKKIEQSYFVQYEQSDNKNNTADNISSTSLVVSCIYEPDDIIYKNFKCKDAFSFNPETDNPYDYINNSIPYSLHLSGDYYITITPGETESDLDLRIDKCDANGQRESIEKVKNWIESLYISPDLFTFHTTCNSDFEG